MNCGVLVSLKQRETDTGDERERKEKFRRGEI